MISTIGVRCSLAVAMFLCAASSWGVEPMKGVWIYTNHPEPGTEENRSEVEVKFAPYGFMPGERADQIAVNAQNPVDRDDRQKGTCIEYSFKFNRSDDWQGVYTLIDGDAWGTKPGINVQQLMAVQPNTKLALRFQAWGEGRVSFKCGGVNSGAFPSSLRLPIELNGSPITLSKEPKEYTIGPIEARRLTNIIDPLCVVASGRDQRGVNLANSNEVRVLVDNVRFETYAQTRRIKRSANWRGRLQSTMTVCYTPTGFNPTARPVARPTAGDIRADLKRIQQLASDAGLSGGRIAVTTYGCDSGLEQVPAIAKELGIAVLIGIFDPRNREEVSNCKALLLDPALDDTILAVAVGNEALTFRRGTLDDIEAVIEELRSVRDVPYTTTEIIQSYGNRRLFELCDFTLVNAHGIFAGQVEPEDCAKWAVAQIAALLDEAPANHPVLIREVGFPSGPSPFTEEQQRLFWATVLSDEVAKRVNIFFFDGLKNVDWKHEPVDVSGNGEVNVGPHWPVLFDSDGNPKPFAKNLVQLWRASREGQSPAVRGNSR